MYVLKFLSSIIYNVKKCDYIGYLNLKKSSSMADSVLAGIPNSSAISFFLPLFTT